MTRQFVLVAPIVLTFVFVARFAAAVASGQVAAAAVAAYAFQNV